MLVFANRTLVIASFLAVSISLAAPLSAYADIPPWIKSNAGWWAEGAISDDEFLAGISHLISTGVITVSLSDVSDTSDTDDTNAGVVPDWVRANAGWWAEGVISDDDFLNGIQYLIQSGLIVVAMPAADDMDDSPTTTTTTTTSSSSGGGDDGSTDPVLAELEAQLAECSEITKAYKRIDCEKPVKQAMLVHDYRTNADMFSVGPINYYWFGLESKGNGFEITQSGQALLSIRMLAENTHTEIASLNCTSPSLCNYDVWDGSTAFRYAGTDFTSGQIVLNPGDAREFNMLFGPNVGYGGSQFLYDPSKSYDFRINESFGSLSIPLGIGQ